MKFLKTLALAALSFAAVVSAQAQGQINFFTFNSGNSSLGRVFDETGAAASTGYMGQLYGSTSSDPGSFVAIGTAANFLTGGGAGYINQGTVTVPNGSGGQTYFVQLRAWKVSSGATYEAAAIRNTSETFSLVLGGGNPPSPVPTANTFANFQLVPEPSTFALGALGIGALLLVRRRKA